MLFDPPIAILVVAALAIGAAGGAVALYWRGERLRSWTTRLVLTTVRIGALVILGLVLLNPVAVRSAAGSAGKPCFTVLMDVSRSMGVADVNHQPRFRVATQQVLGNSSLMADLQARWDVNVFSFGEATERTTLDSLRQQAKPAANRTELGEALTTVVSSASKRQGRSAGVLLVSDGRDNGSTPPLAAARIARSAGLPMWTLCLGSASAAKDAAVLAYTSQDFAFAKQPTTLSAEARLQGYGARTVTVTLERNGQPTASRTLTFTDDGRQTARFPVTEANPGLYRYTFGIAPLEGELNTANNKRTIFLRVINDKVKVLLVDARPSWDTKFLSQALRKDRSVALTSIYRFARSRDYAVTADEKASAKGVKLPQRFEDLAPYEVVMIGKGFEDLLTEKGVELLKRYLLERAGSVVFFRGKADAGCEALRDLEPVIWSADEVRNLQLTLTEEGRQSPLFAFGSRDDPQTVIRQLPSLISATRVQDTRAFSVVLARAEGRDGNAEQMATVAYQRYGGGRVMVIAGQGLWQWGFLPDELNQYAGVYRTFWSQMLRWLVGGSDFLPGQEFSLKTDRLSYAIGEKVSLLVYAKRKLEPNARLTLEVVQPDGTRVPVSPGPSRAAGAALAGMFTPRQTGDYSAILRTGPREADELVAPFTVTPGQQEDLVVAADPQLMRQIAEASGGKAITAEDLPDLPDQLREVERRALLREERQSVWDKPLVFLVLCALLSTEWYLRRREGLC